MRHIKKLATRIGNKGTQVTTTEILKKGTPKITIQKTVVVSERIESPTPVINILTRTSNRPNGFKRCRESIENQTYKNIRHIVSIDNLNDEEYVKSHNVDYFFMDKEAISKENDIPDPKTGTRFIYNLYLNHLINEVKEGWILFLDDDDYLADNNTVQKMVNAVKNPTDLVLWQMKYPNGQVLPSIQELGTPPRLARIGAPCFMLHSGIAKTIRWDGWKCGDFRFIQKAYAKTGEKRVIREVLISLGGAGLGMKKDINTVQSNPISNKVYNNIEFNSVIDVFKKKFEIPNEKKEYYDFIITFSTYKRNEMIKTIIQKIYSQDTEYTFKIILLNDGNDIENFKLLFSEFENIKILHNTQNNGKKKYWESINKLLQEVKRYNYQYLLQLDDDHDPIDNFLNSLMGNLKQHSDETIFKLAVNQNYLNEKMESQPRWGLKDWVDGGTAYPKIVFDKIGYYMKEIPKSRWHKNEFLGSGVWEQVSRRLNKYNFKTHTPLESYVNHLGYKDSIMNTELRKKQHLKTINLKK
jgi:hypothetical protein